MSGLEKYSHLEDKIHRTVELCKSLRSEKAQLEAELERARQEVIAEQEEKSRLRAQLAFLLDDRDGMKLKVEAILDAITMLELESDSTKK
jgi:predicted nuclease with TOPRIM domain